MSGVMVQESISQQLATTFHDVEMRVADADYSEELEEFLPFIAEGEAEAFSGQRSPGGEAWSPLAESTVRRKGHSQILVDSGDLAASLVSAGGLGNIHDVAARGLVFGTNVAYSIFHQDGTSRMPQREQVGMSDETLSRLVNMIADATVNRMKLTP